MQKTFFVNKMNHTLYIVFTEKFLFIMLELLLRLVHTIVRLFSSSFCTSSISRMNLSVEFSGCCDGRLTCSDNSIAGMVIESMDMSADPCEDFAQFACGGWTKKNLIPESKSSYNTFTKLRDEVAAQMKGNITPAL